MLTDSVSGLMISKRYYLSWHYVLTYFLDVTTVSGSGTKGSAGSASRSRPGINSQKDNSASRSTRTAWGPTYGGKSKAYVESGTGRKDFDKFSDAASDNSERAIVVKTTVDVD